jgi:hypothetical protein
MPVVDLKGRTKRVRKRAPPDLVPLAKATGAGRFFNRMVRDIHNDLGGKRQLTRIQNELICAFSGAATHLQYLNYQIMLGETGEVDLAGYSQVASTMLRIGVRLGLRPRQETVPTMDEFLRERGHQLLNEPAPSDDDGDDEEEIIPSYAGDEE